MTASLTAAVLAALANSLVAACPSVTATDGRTIEYAAGATPACQAAAQAAMNNYNPSLVPGSTMIPTGTFIGRLTAAEHAAIKAGQDPVFTAIEGAPTVDLASPTVTNWVNSLVISGTIAAARSPVIVALPAKSP